MSLDHHLALEEARDQQILSQIIWHDSRKELAFVKLMIYKLRT
jgi:hypothetical protein